MYGSTPAVTPASCQPAVTPASGARAAGIKIYWEEERRALQAGPGLGQAGLALRGPRAAAPLRLGAAELPELHGPLALEVSLNEDTVQGVALSYPGTALPNPRHPPVGVPPQRWCVFNFRGRGRCVENVICMLIACSMPVSGAGPLMCI